MSARETSLDRFAALSDAIFAVITIMVLDLRPPARRVFRALLELWPEAVRDALDTFTTQRAATDRHS